MVISQTSCHACKGGAVEIRERTHADGRKVQARQCVRCGQFHNNIKKADYIADPPPYDEALSGRMRDLRWQEEQREREAKRVRTQQEERAEWFKGHNEYLRSPEWKRLRQLVIKRDKGICQGCLLADGTQVHHLTYVRHKRELLIDLVLLCDACHERAHEAA